MPRPSHALPASLLCLPARYRREGRTCYGPFRATLPGAGGQQRDIPRSSSWSKWVTVVSPVLAPLLCMAWPVPKHFGICYLPWDSRQAWGWRGQQILPSHRWRSRDWENITIAITVIIYRSLRIGRRAGLFTSLVSPGPPGVCAGGALGGTQLLPRPPALGTLWAPPPLQILKTIFCDCVGVRRNTLTLYIEAFSDLKLHCLFSFWKKLEHFGGPLIVSWTPSPVPAAPDG